MRYLRRAISIILLIIFFGILALVIVARTPIVNRLLRDKVMAFVAANYLGTLDIGRIEGSVWGSLRLEHVALAYQGKTIASIPRLSLQYSLVPLLWRAIHLKIAVDSPQIDVSREPNAKWNLLEALSARVPTKTSSGKRAFTIDIDSIEVNNAALQLVPTSGGAKYRVTNVNLDLAVMLPSSGMAVELRRLTASIAAPKMPLLYTAVSVNYDATVSPARVQVADVELRTQRSTVSMSGEARLERIPFVNLKVSLPRLAAADIDQIYPASQLKADISGTVGLRGPQNALHTIVALNLADAALEGSADTDISSKSPVYAANLKVSNANLTKIVRINNVAGVFDASITAKGTGSDMSAASVEVHLHGRSLRARQYNLGTLDMTANAANKNAHVILSLAAPGGHLAARANTTISKDPAYHLELTAAHLNVSKAGIATGIRQTNLNVATVIDGHGLTPAAANTGIRVTVDRSQIGQIAIDRGVVDARVANNQINLARLHFDAAQSTLDVHGSAGLAANAPANIWYVLHSPDIRELLQVAKIKGTGAIDINGSLNGPRSDLRTGGTINLSHLQSAGYSVGRGNSRYNLALTAPGAPFGNLDVIVDEVKAGAQLRTVSVAIDAPRGLPHAMALRLRVIDNAGRKDLVATHLKYEPPSITGQLTQMSLGLPGGDWYLTKPVDYSQTPRAVSMSTLQLRSGSRELVLEGTIAKQGAQDFNLVMDRFDIAALQPLTNRLHDIHGMLSTKLRVAGTGEAPTLRLDAAAAKLSVGGQPIGNLSASINYAGERALFETLLQQNPSDRLTATGSLPMSLSWNNGVKAKLGSAIDLTVNSARLSLAQLGSLFPDDVRNLQGVAAVDLHVQGSLKQPQSTGSVRITGVGGQVIPLGITLSQARLIVNLDPRAVHIESLEAHAGRGTITGNGEIGLVRYAPNALEINLLFQQWPAIDTQQYAATIGGHLIADGTISRPRLHGTLEVLNGVIQPDIAFLGATSNLSPDDTIEVIQPGQRALQPVNNTAGANGRPFTPPAAPPQPSAFNNLAMKIAVIIHRNTWIRHPDAAAELEGNLDVDKDPGGPIRVAGEVRTVRGWMNYYNRQFTLKTGVFTFTGGRKIDPQLDIDAQYPVTNYTIDIVVGGSASKPSLQLKSQPELAQADILSLILFGKTTDALGQGQRTGLQQQATKMATGVAAHQIGQAVSSSMGLQRMGITLNDTSSGTPAVGVGHYLGENTYVSASQPIGGSGGQKLSVQYFLLRWLSITTSSAADGSHEIDLNLIKQY